MPLKGIPSIISPDLLRVLAMMGHGDEIVLADAYFPATSISKSKSNPILLRADGIGIPALLDAILRLIELDTYSYSPAILMDLVEEDKRKGIAVDIWAVYQSVLDKRVNRPIPISYLSRYDFYSRARTAFCVVQTGETSIYGNIILTNGIVGENLVPRPIFTSDGKHLYNEKIKAVEESGLTEALKKEDHEAKVQSTVAVLSTNSMEVESVQLLGSSVGI